MKENLTAKLTDGGQYKKKLSHEYAYPEALFPIYCYLIIKENAQYPS